MINFKENSEYYRNQDEFKFNLNYRMLKMTLETEFYYLTNRPGRELMLLSCNNIELILY